MKRKKDQKARFYLTENDEKKLMSVVESDDNWPFPDALGVEVPESQEELDGLFSVLLIN